MADPSNVLGEKGNALHREEERQVALKAFPSVFCVLFDLWHKLPQPKRVGSSKKVERDYKRMTEDVNNAEKKFVKLPSDLRADDGQRNSTGFVIASEGNKLRILTCAHGIAEIYSKGVHNLTCDMVNEFYRIEVYCIHQESEVEAMMVSTPVSQRRRHCTQANVVAIDSKFDLLVLEVDVRRLCLRKEGRKVIWCQDNHPVLELAKSNPLKADN